METTRDKVIAWAAWVSAQAVVSASGVLCLSTGKPLILEGLP